MFLLQLFALWSFLEFQRQLFGSIFAQYIIVFLNIKLETESYGLRATVLKSKLNSFVVVKVCMCGRLSEQWLC